MKTSATVESLLTRVAREARRDPERVRPVLQVLLGEEPEPVTALRPVVTGLNDARRATAFEEFRSGALGTDAVRNLLGLRSRQAVHALRDRGRLLGRTFGNATLFPAWQFEGPALRPDLPAIIERLRRFSADAVAADRVMRLPRAELDGRSLIEALDDAASRDLAFALLDRLGAGF
jgi:hypothetical protein